MLDPNLRMDGKPMPNAVTDTPRRHRLSVDAYHAMSEAGILGQDARVELINGEIIDMAPIGSRHAAAVKQLMRMLDRSVGDQAIVSVQDPIRLDDHTEPRPDLALLHPREDYYKSAHPGPSDVLLIIEVADRSLQYDRDTKLPLYARAGIPEAWLLDLASRTLTRHCEPGPDGYRRGEAYTDRDRITLPTPLDSALDLRGLL